MHKFVKNNPQASGHFSRTLCLILVLLLGISLLYLGCIAYRLEIDYSDSFETFLNARSIATLRDNNYSFKRPLIFSLLLSPPFIAENFFPGFNPVRACHWMAVGFWGILLVMLYRLSRLDLTRRESLFAVFLFSLCPVLIHQAPFSKEDIPGALFLISAFYFYRRGRHKKPLRNFLLAGCLMVLTVDTRRALIPLVGAVLGLYEVLTLKVTRDFTLKILALGIFPAGLFFLFPIVIYPLIGHASFFDAPHKLIDEIFLQYRIFSMVREPAAKNYIFLLKAVSIPFLFCALIGFLVSVYRRQPGTLFHALWFFIFFIFFTHFLARKEARYLLPVLPPLYIFVWQGIKAAGDFLKARITNPPCLRIVQGLVFLLILGIPAHRAFAEYGKFLDPVYTSRLPQEISRYALELAGDNHLITWAGTLYALNPKDYIFDNEDDFFYIYHFYFHVMRFYTKRTVWGFQGADIPAREKGQKEIFVGPQLGRFRKNGDVMVVNPEPAMYETRNMAEHRLPLVVERIRTAVFAPATGDILGEKVFQSAEWPDAKVRVQMVPGGFQVAGEGIPDGHYELYLEIGQVPYPLAFEMIRVEHGRFEALKPEVKTGLPVTGLFLFYYDSVREFSI